MERSTTRRGVLALGLATAVPLAGCAAADDVAEIGANGARTAADDATPVDSSAAATDRLPEPHGDDGVVAVGEGRTGGRGIPLDIGANVEGSTPRAVVVEYEFAVDTGTSATAAVLSRADYEELSNGVVDVGHDYHLLVEDRAAGRARGTLPSDEYVLYVWSPLAAQPDDSQAPRTTVVEFEYRVTYRD